MNIISMASVKGFLRNDVGVKKAARVDRLQNR